MSQGSLIHRALEQGRGILRLAPNWVPRSFCIPGRRIKLHPDDYYALGGERGGIDERWFSSTTPAENGPLTGENEGLSDINRRETIAVLPLIVMVFWIGLYPKFFLDKMNPAVDSFVTDFTVRYYEGRRTAEPKLVDFDQLRKQLEEAGATVEIK